MEKVKIKEFMNQSKRVSIIGLGAMGMSISQVFLKSGWTVFGVDVRPETMKKFKKYGGRPLENTSEAAKNCELMLLMVINEKQCEEVLFGEKGGCKNFHEGFVVINCSTVSSEFAKNTATRLKKLMTGYLDAPVSGGTKGARNGTLSIMVSGPEDDLKKSRPALETISSKIYHLGLEAGLGSSMKMINQLLVGIHIVSAAEAVVLAQKIGLDFEKVFEVITHSAGNSWAFEDRVPRMHEGEIQIQSSLDIFLKDLGIVLERAKALQLTLPVSESAFNQYEISHKSGMGKEDDSSIYKNYLKTERI